MLSIGLMSGTSMDGIDAALLETNGTPTLVNDKGYASLSYDLRFSLLLKATEYAVRQCKGDLAIAKRSFSSFIQQYCQNHFIDISGLTSYFGAEPLSYELIERHSTELHANVVRDLLEKTHYSSNDIEVIGYHGQTLYHQPERKCSIMLGDPQYLADLLKIRVVYDFRRNDIEAGGQGAPFAPLYHQALAIRDKLIPLAVVNCGGISNITLITGENETDVIGFDTGPGNALIDSLIRARTQGKECMDQDGQYGMRGKVDEDLLHALYDKAVMKNGENYFYQKPPKSLDYGDLKLIPELDKYALEDACITLEVFTAYTIVDSLKWCDPVPDMRWILAGGGWKNPVILEAFKTRLNAYYGEAITIQTAEEAGLHSAAIEAQIFAYFAVRSLLNKPLSMPLTTRVPYPLSGGEAYLPRSVA